MTRLFWALPVFAKLVLASQSSFSVLDDLLAFPQYQIVFADTAITEDHARSLHAASLSNKQQPITDDAAATAQTTVELSSQQTHDNDDNDKHLFRGDGNAPPPANPFKGSTHSSSSSSNNDDDDNDSELPAIYERIILHSQPYLCRVPVIQPATPANNTASAANATASKQDEEKELARASDRGWELLKGMQGNCIYFLSGWWSYSFCYNEDVRQFHQLPPGRGVPVYPPVEDPNVSSFVLGTFPRGAKKGEKGVEGSEEEVVVDDEGVVGKAKGRDSEGRETGLARLETKGETRYLVQKLMGGTTCDLTGKERKIEVQFHCHPNTPDRIGMIKEIATCSYLMVIYTPRLCNDVAFLPPQENRAHAISCAPIVRESNDVPSITHHRHKSNPKHVEEPSIETDIELPEALAAAFAANEYQQQRATSTPLPTIGGIPVGAQRLVGKPGSVIEKSVVVGGGKETLLGVVAESDGGGRNERMMSAEELKELRIEDKKEVEKLRRQLTKLAGRKPWRLELVDTPRGREFRGIIEKDEGEDRDGEEKGGDGKKKTEGEGRREEQKQGQVGEGEGEGGDDGLSDEWEDVWEWEWLDGEDAAGDHGENAGAGGRERFQGGRDGDDGGDDRGDQQQEGSQEEYRDEL